MDAVGRADPRLHGAVDRPGQQLAGERTQAVCGRGRSARVTRRSWSKSGRLYTMYRPASPRAAPQPGRGRHRARCRDRQDHLGAPVSVPDRRRRLHRGRRSARHAADRRQPLFVVGSRREFFALDKATGKVLWSHDFIKEYGAPGIDRGMANSPLLFNNTIILPIGGTRPGGRRLQSRDRRARCGRPATSSTRRPRRCSSTSTARSSSWCSAAIASPASIRPTAATLWSHPHRTDWGLNISTPVWSPGRSPAALLVGVRHRQPRARAAAGRAARPR